MYEKLSAVSKSLLGHVNVLNFSLDFPSTVSLGCCYNRRL